MKTLPMLEVLLRRTHGLEFGQFPVYTFLLHKVLMSSLLHDLALVKNIDNIGVLDRAQSMRNGDCRAALRS